MDTWIITLITTCSGVVLGWLLTLWSNKNHDRPKLCFTLCTTPEDELIEKELRTKTSSSEYSIRIYNTGREPFILTNFTLHNKGTTIVDCFMPEPDEAIIPYHSAIYILSEQDADALEYHCKLGKFDSCRITAYSVDDKKVHGKLDIPLIAMRMSISDSGIVKSK